MQYRYLFTHNGDTRKAYFENGLWLVRILHIQYYNFTSIAQKGPDKCVKMKLWFLPTHIRETKERGSSRSRGSESLWIHQQWYHYPGDWTRGRWHHFLFRPCSASDSMQGGEINPEEGKERQADPSLPITPLAKINAWSISLLHYRSDCSASPCTITHTRALNKELAWMFVFMPYFLPKLPLLCLISAVPTGAELLCNMKQNKMHVPDFGLLFWMLQKKNKKTKAVLRV